VLGEALATVQDTGEHWWEAEIHRLKGELLLLLAAQKGDSQTTPTETAMVAEQDIGGARWVLPALRRGDLFSRSPRDCPAATSQISGTAGGAEPACVIATPGPGRRGSQAAG
jgi:hypothetical protein